MNKPAAMPATRFGGVIRLTLLFAAQLGFIVVFHALGSIDKFAIDFSNFSQWLDTTPPEVALVASIRILALAFSYWMLATSILYMVARSFRIPGLLRAMELTTLPGVRRVIDAGLAATIIGGTVFGGAAAVFAKSSDASKIAAPAAVTRTLYVPVASDDLGGPSTSLVNTDATVTDSVPLSSNAVTAAPSGTDKVVLSATPAPSQTPTPEDTSTPPTNTTPHRADDGSYIPVPSDSTPDEERDAEEEPSDTTTSSPKVVLPADSEPTTTTTSPKVAVPSTDAPVTTPGVEVDGKQVVKPDETPAPTTSAADTAYTVVAGDNFWKIAKEQVSNALGREPSNAEVANYWVTLIDANRSTIRSGDPDLIFPGEVFTLPPV